MCLTVFSVLMSLSAYIIRATDMHSIKKQLTYLSVVYVLSWHTEHTVQSSNMHYTSSRQISWQSVESLLKYVDFCDFSKWRPSAVAKYLDFFHNKLLYLTRQKSNLYFNALIA